MWGETVGATVGGTVGAGVESRLRMRRHDFVIQDAGLYRPSPRVRWGVAMARMVRSPRPLLAGGRRHDANANHSGTLQQVQAAVGSLRFRRLLEVARCGFCA